MTITTQKFLEAEKEKIIGLRDELECKQDLTIQEESKTNEIFSSLCCKRKKAIHQLDLQGEKLVKLGEPKTKIDAAKE